MSSFPLSANMKPLVLAMAFASAASSAHAFEIAFDWSGLKPCTSGFPNRVSNPRFRLKGVPSGTRYIHFRLKDLDVPGYNHGGGLVPYDGRNVIEPGAFTYNSPCPPNGSHTYEWKATAQSRKNGGVLATARARRKYPE